MTEIWCPLHSRMAESTAIDVYKRQVYDRTRDAVVCFACGRGDVIASLAAFSFPRAEAMDLVPEHTSRALNREFEDKLIMTVARRMRCV